MDTFEYMLSIEANGEPPLLLTSSSPFPGIAENQLLDFDPHSFGEELRIPLDEVCVVTSVQHYFIRLSGDDHTGHYRIATLVQTETRRR